MLSHYLEQFLRTLFPKYLLSSYYLAPTVMGPECVIAASLHDEHVCRTVIYLMQYAEQLHMS